GHCRRKWCGDVIDVAGRILNLLDLQRVDDDAELLHLTVTSLFDLLGETVTLTDDLFDGQAADDGTKVTGKDAAHQFLHVVLLGKEPPCRVGDRRRVIPDLERGDRPDMQPDPLSGDAILGDFGLLKGKGEKTGLLLDREDEASVPRDDAELGVLLLAPRS